MPTWLFTAKYKILIGLAALAVFAAALFGAHHLGYSKGYDKGEGVSRVAIAQYQTKMQKLNNELLIKEQKVTERVVTQYRDRIVERDKIVYRNAATITKLVPTQCYLSRGWVYAHDTSAASKPIESARASDASPSGISDNEALGVVAENYGNHNKVADQLEALQTWIKEVNETRRSSTVKP